jgi:hypothetical protein
MCRVIRTVGSSKGVLQYTNPNVLFRLTRSSLIVQAKTDVRKDLR